MRDSFLEIFSNVIKIRVEGNNVNRFLKRLIANKIELLNVKLLNRNVIVLKVYHKDYERILELKSIYDIHFENTYGIIRIKKIASVNRVIILSVLMGFIILNLLSNMVFKIEVIHIDPYIRNLLFQELDNHGIQTIRFKMDFKEIEAIKNSILNKHRDKLEWLEIEEVGTRYIVRVEERKLDDIPVIDGYRHVVAAKDAVIKDIDAYAGEIAKNINDYVKVGDIIISGEIFTPGGEVNLVSAEGRVYGEVWYQVTVEYPFVIHEEIPTGRTKKGLAFYLLNNRFDLFDFNKFKQQKIISKPILKNNLIPFGIAMEEQIELDIKTEINTYNEAYLKALEVAREKIENNLKEEEYIISENSLKIDVKDSKIVVDMFYAVHEDITNYQEIVEEQIVE